MDEFLNCKTRQYQFVIEENKSMENRGTDFNNGRHMKKKTDHSKQYDTHEDHPLSGYHRMIRSNFS